MKGELVIVVILASNGTGMARAQNGRDELQPLVATSARRLAVAEQVALAKWDSGAAVDDAKREAQVIIAAVKYGESKGLGQTFITNFFTAQIEANKFIQYSLLADWRRAGRAPAHTAINLATIREQLDRLQIDLIDELAHTVFIRARATCQDDAAKAIGKYVVAHHHHDDRPLQTIALDRALATVCTSR
jgi:chorismate mutase